MVVDVWLGEVPQHVLAHLLLDDLVVLADDVECWYLYLDTLGQHLVALVMVRHGTRDEPGDQNGKSGITVGGLITFRAF